MALQAIHWAYTEGRVSAVIPHLKRQLGGYLSTYGRIHIGATTDPGVTAQQYARQGFDKVVMVYKSAWPGAARSVERRLNQAAHAWRFTTTVDSPAAGGEELPSGRAAYFVFLAVGPRASAEGAYHAAGITERQVA